MRIPSRSQIEALVEAARRYIFECGTAQEVGGAAVSLVGMREGEVFTEALPKIRENILLDVQAIKDNDPAAASTDEIVACYPGLVAILHYRVAHQLHIQGVEVIPRMICERAHSLTGIDIHPAASIGRWFAIDHGTGVVIGATSIIGDHVMLYQGVTLGAKNFRYDDKGHPIDQPRHPVLQDNVTVYSNTSILGRVTIGHDTIIGGNVWLTHDVPPHSRVLQRGAVYMHEFENGEGI